MFGYTLIKKEELKRYGEMEARYLALVHYHHWFSGWKDVHWLLEQFVKGKVYNIGVWNVREEFANRMGTDRYGKPIINSESGEQA